MSQFTIRHLIFCVIGCLCYQSPLLAEEEVDIQHLLEQGHFWHERGRFDLAESAWRKVLMTDPNNVEALTALREATAVDAGETVDQQKLQLARTLTSEGRFEAALSAYQEAFRGAPPTSNLVSEYYQTLAGTEKGWPVALEKLEALVETYPSSTSYALSLAKIKTYREHTRREGIDELQRLSETPSMRDESMSAWKDALIWLDATAADQALYEAYLQSVPEDTEIQQKLTGLTESKLSYRDENIGQAYELLRKGELKAAAEKFQLILNRSPDDADALGGLGVTRLRQQRFEQAEILLTKAIRGDASKRDQWQSPLNTARYWSLLSQATQAQENGELNKAEIYLKRAQKLKPQQTEGLMALADVEFAQGKTEAAIGSYRSVLRLQPENSEAQDSLLTLLLKSGKEQEALELVNQYRLSEEDFFRKRDHLYADKLRKDASKAADSGNVSRAIELLDDAKTLDTTNVWIRLDLSKLYLQQGRVNEAYGVFDDLLAAEPLNADALYAKALVSNEAQEWLTGLETLELIPNEQRTAEHRALQNRLWATYQKERVVELVQQGDMQSAEKIAQEVGKIANRDPALRGIYAGMLAELGDHDQALRIMRREMDMNAETDMNMRLQYAGLLLQTGHEGELDAMLDSLRLSRQLLSPAQQKNVERLEKGLALRRADRKRQEGELGNAYEELLPWLQGHADDPTVLQLMAALYGDAGDQERALAVYQRVLKNDPNNVSAYEGATGAAMILGDYERAGRIVNSGIEANPDSPKLYATRGRLMRLQGDHNSSAEDLRTALTLYRSEQTQDIKDGIYLDQAFGQYPLTLAEQEAFALNTEFPFEPYVDGVLSRIEDPAWVKSAREELAELEAGRAQTMISGGVMLRGREGDAGIDELSAIEAPLNYQTAVGYSSTIGFQVKPVSLDAGELNGGSEAATRFGTLALNSAAYQNINFDQDADGVALGAFYQGMAWRFDIGSTPLGFEVENVLGGIAWSPRLAKGKSINVAIERRAITETLLSYGGTKDPRTGTTWGGVTRTGLGVQFARDNGSYGFYGEPSYYFLEGENVKDNEVLGAEGGVYWKPYKVADQEYTVGVHLNFKKYQNNLRYFTLGHGGYFSPERLISLTVPLELKGYTGALSYRLGADLGVQYFREEDAAYYPDDGALQSNLNTLAAGDPTLRSRYEGQTDTGGIYNLKAEFEYELDKQLSLGGMVSANNAKDYKENSVFFFLRYLFEPRSSVSFPNASRILDPFDRT